MTIRFIPMKITWQGIMPVMIAGLRNPEANIETIKECTNKLMRLAQAMDEHNTMLEKTNEVKPLDELLTDREK